MFQINYTLFHATANLSSISSSRSSSIVLYDSTRCAHSEICGSNRRRQLHVDTFVKLSLDSIPHGCTSPMEIERTAYELRPLYPVVYMLDWNKMDHRSCKPLFDTARGIDYRNNGPVHCLTARCQLIESL